MRPLLAVDAGVVDYDTACDWQRELHGRRLADEIPDVLLLLEHPHVYTLGRRFSSEHLLADKADLESAGIEVAEADRGGSITYHGPGQLVAYPILDLRRPGKEHPDAIRYLRILEEAIIRTVRTFGLIATRRQKLTGVWVGERKLASIGVNISRGISKHGLALNVSTDLSYFERMVPCGIEGCAVTSVVELTGGAPDMGETKGALTVELSDLLHRLPIDSDLGALGLRHAAEVIDLKGRKAG